MDLRGDVGRRAIVEIRWGKLAGTKALVTPGSALVVGRTDHADLVVPHDGKMSHVHFELRWDGGACQLRDLGSMTGTRLNGLEVKASAVAHGDWIQAGETNVMVYFEGHTPPPAQDDDEDDDDEDAESRREREARKDAAEEALAELWTEAASEPLYAILDAAREDRILELLREHAEPHRSLYEGAAGEPLDEVAPYLVGPMRADSMLLDRLVMEGWGKRWGIWCTSREPFAEVRRHFRRFLMVELEETEEKVYFRFYDPDVLLSFVDVATEDQRDEIMGPLGDLLAEHKEEGFEVWHAS